MKYSLSVLYVLNFGGNYFMQYMVKCNKLYYHTRAHIWDKISFTDRQLQETNACKIMSGNERSRANRVVDPSEIGITNKQPVFILLNSTCPDIIKYPVHIP